jgi:hypothetical protein
MRSPLAYGLIFSLHPTHLTLYAEWQRNDTHLMRQLATSSRTMAPNSDTRENFITWFTKEFGFTRNAATALYDVQTLKDAQALSELDDDAVANVCKAVGKDIGQSVANIAATKLKLACLWVRHQYRTSREIGGTQRLLVKIKYSGEIDRLREQKREGGPVGCRLYGAGVPFADPRHLHHHESF